MSRGSYMKTSAEPRAVAPPPPFDDGTSLQAASRAGKG